MTSSHWDTYVPSVGSTRVTRHRFILLLLLKGVKSIFIFPMLNLLTGGKTIIPKIFDYYQKFTGNKVLYYYYEIIYYLYITSNNNEPF